MIRTKDQECGCSGSEGIALEVWGRTKGRTQILRTAPFKVLRASPPQNCKQHLYFRIQYRLMMTVSTHKRHKSPFKHSKTIYVFTSGRVIVTVQIHSRKKLLKGLEWPLQIGHSIPSIPESSRICSILPQDLVKRGVCRCGDGDALSPYLAYDQ
jgi:hypothetical protein